MYSTPGISQSSPKNNTTIMSDTINGFPRNFSSPKLTSTPLHRNGSIYATPPPKPHLLSPKRYSLSEVSTPPHRYLNRSHSLTRSGDGPLLGTLYPVKLSTFVDAKSPGLAARAVQYSEERKRISATHQKQYGVPGLFPIVHLFKKDLPPLNLQPKRITVRIASPEQSRCNSPEYNRLLLEGIVKESASKPCVTPQSSDVSSTRSVLDALKEISRKRIHTNDEFDVLEDPGKRQKTDQYEKEKTKRYREESPPLDQCNSLTNSTKRVCINSDEYAASCSSMNYSLNETMKPTSKRKSKSSPEKQETAQVKRVTVETQTISIGDHQTEEKKTSDKKKETVSKETAVPNLVRRVFNDEPLERIRKHRLATLLGTLAHTEAFINEEIAEKEPKKFSLGNNVEAATTPDKTLTSILSTPKKTSPKTLSKHVTFNIPDVSVDQADISKKDALKPATPDVTPTPASSPVMFDKKKTDADLKTNENTASVSKPIQFGQTNIFTTALSFTPISTTSITSVAPIISRTVPIVASSSPVVATFAFGKPTASVPSTNQFPIVAPVAVATTTASSPPKTGGFKFDLSKPATTMPATTLISTPSSTLTFGQTKATSPPNSVFGQTTIAAVPQKTTAAPVFGIQPISNAQSGPSSLQLPSGGITFGVRPSTATTTTTSIDNKPLFSVKATNPPAYPMKSTAPPSFGAPTTVTPTFGNVTSSTASTFGAVTTTASIFGASSVTSAPTFGTSTSASTSAAPSFGAAVSTAPPLFGTVTSSTLSFGNVTSSTPTFGAITTSVPSFGGGGASTASTFVLGNSTTSTTPSFPFNNSNYKSPPPAFGSTTNAPPSFGVVSSTTTTAPPPAFGALASKPANATTNTVTTTSANIFAFGKPSNSFSFGQNQGGNAFNSPPVVAVTTSSVFGASFGSKQPPPPAFGATNTNAPFVTSNSNTFNSPTVTNSNSFAFGGAPTVTTTTAAPMLFGSNTNNTNNIFTAKVTSATPTFGSATNIFQSTAQTSANLFPSSSKPLFGGSNFTNTTPSFGSTNNNGNMGSFGASNSFATNTTTSSFTTPTSTFGATATTTANTMFGTSATPSFGASNSFSGGFGTTAAPPPAAASSSVFGGQAPPAFGGTTFGANNNSSFGFGSNTTTAAFTPTTTTNSFGGAPVAQPAANSSGGIFTFGAPSNTGYNFTAGGAGGGPPSFGGSPSVAPAAVAPGMFSIGSGSPSTNRARSSNRGRRRP